MATDSRLYRGLSHSPDPYRQSLLLRSQRSQHFNESTASAPSLRALTPVDDHGRDSMAGQDDAANVKVVVRVRAFVRRELEQQRECIISMDPRTQTTTLHAPSVDSHTAQRRAHLEDKSFTFDKSFWSHNVQDSHYAHQEDVYRSFGEEFLDHNFDGYHTCIFAYGQTGSGKSYTMMGSPDSPGLIPRTCENLFWRIQNEPQPNTAYNVHVSYFEVYNEHVRDLLVPKSGREQTYLKIRESATDGVYVQGLTDVRVENYEDIQRLLKLGDVNRTTAATKMNDTSSRSHAVFTIMLKQLQHSLTTDETIERVARMRLVDLAGSERAKSTEATGQRLVEGGKINKSLTTLGRVIAALADNASVKPGMKKKKEIVPYRDSVLTWLLKDSLGGNSKTAMVACISPTDYDETLSTLRYADQAKRIRTRATVNQDALSKAERDAQIAAMEATIRQLELSLVAAHTNATARHKMLERSAKAEQDEMERMSEYQKEVNKMRRMMEETKQVNDSKIRALTAEVEELRPAYAQLKSENEALRRHLNLALSELKNPIKLPPREASPPPEEELEKQRAEEERKRNEELEREREHETMIAEFEDDMKDLLGGLSLWRKRLGDDGERFGVSLGAGEVEVS